MALDGIYSSLSALRVVQTRTAQTANDLANLSTPGYVPQRINQAEVAGGGVAVSGTTPLSSGPIVSSDRPLDLALDGPGFFVLDDGNGGQLYTRDGNFQLDAQGRLVDSQGRAVQPGITLPADTAQVQVTSDGQVQALASDGSILAQGQLQTTSFANPGGLEAVSGNAYRATALSGAGVTDVPGSAGHGQVVSGALQGSGSDIVTSMINLNLDLREFEANVKSIRTQDDMVGSILDVVG